MSGPHVAYLMAISFGCGAFVVLIVGQLRETKRAYDAHCRDLERRREDFHRQQRFAARFQDGGAK
jgi:hypothetical protein